MNCEKCQESLLEDAKFCTKCGTPIPIVEKLEEISVNNSEEWDLKKVLTIIGSFAIFILVFFGSRWLSYEGTSKVISEYNNNKTEQKIEKYFTDTSTWKEFNSTIGKFKATFPTYPEYETQNIEIRGFSLKYDIYSSETSDGTTYMINMVTYPSGVDTSNPDINLEGSLNGALASDEGNKLISSNFTYFNGYRALDFLIINGDIIYMKGKIIMVGKTLYQIMVAYESQNYNESIYNNFINTFIITK